MDKTYLAHVGLSLARAFVEKNRNQISMPEFHIYTDVDEPEVRRIKAVRTCGYYRRNHIHVAVPLCSHKNANYSWPGFISDRTPYGVIQHELGHHVDQCKSAQDIYRNNSGSFYSDMIRLQSGEKPITSYSPNNMEWFAEMVRLFITNPDLLKQIRPRTYKALTETGLEPVVTAHSGDVLLKWQAPPRVFERADNWINNKK